MSNYLRPVVTVAVAASILTGCAASQEKTGFGGKADVNVGLATRAMMALNAKDFSTAIDFAQRAVEKTPTDAGFRAILGNAYFAAGRFASAETAYKDSLTIYSNQPQVILKLALAETALGKKDQAVAFLEAGRSVLDPSNYGLALALAGRPADAITVLEQAARQPGADATVRQNLALAHALAGNWAEARTIAAQDVSADKLDARIHQWMQLTGPQKPESQVAALVGVTPAVTDQGEPVRLALNTTDTMMASAAPVQAPAATPAPAQVSEAAASPVVEAAPALLPEVSIATPAPATPAAKFVEAVEAPEAAPAPAPGIVSTPEPQPKLTLAPVIADASLPLPVAMVAAAVQELPTFVRALTAKKAPVSVHHARAPRVVRPVVGPGDAIVQLGSYRSPQNLNVAWNVLTKRHPALRHYLPLRARFVSSKGVFWRLSIQGFDSQHDAVARCNLLKSNGGKCFVRSFAGDAPVQIAMN